MKTAHRHQNHFTPFLCRTCFTDARYTDKVPQRAAAHFPIKRRLAAIRVARVP